ncbi:MAG: glycosyltransferase family 2 protein [Armatimonadota bacterium]
MRCSVLIVNWRTSELLRELLLSLRRHPASGGQEVIVVDNASDDFDEAAFRREFPEVHFLLQRENLGFAAGNNLALRHSTGEHLVLLNPDTQVTEGALDILLDFLESHPSAAIAAPQLVFPDGTVQDSCRSFPWPMSILFTAMRLHILFPRSRLLGAYRMTWFDHHHTRQVDQPMATCWAVRRSVVEQLGLFDEDFPILFNDVDFCWRVRQAGWEIWFVADARVLHVGGAGTKKGGAALFAESHRGLVRFYRKNLRGRTPAIAIALASLVSWLNCVGRTLSARRVAAR